MNDRQVEKFYFDYASTTPLDPRVFEAMRPYFMEEFGNASNLYELGHRARQAVEKSLDKIVSVLNCKSEEFIFTGSATESDNLAILGVARANKDSGNKIIISNVEHKGIIAACGALKEEGFEIYELKVKENGLINPEDLKKLLDKETVLVSVTLADNETGTIQPIKELAEVIKKFRQKNNRPLPYFHTDAVQAALYLDLDVEKLGIDLMTLSSHKIYGPKGIAGLYIRKGTDIKPIIFGGGHQNKLRSGTENVPGIIGFAEALGIASKEKDKESERIKKLRDKLQKGILKSIPKVVVNSHPTRRLPNFINVSILDIEGEALLLHLSEKGIYVNTGSACNAEKLEPSHILKALGLPYEYIHGSIRFTLGKSITEESINYVLKHLPEIVYKLRRISPLNLDIGNKKIISQPRAFIGGKTPHFLRGKI